jgi:hypothetical protein
MDGMVCFVLNAGGPVQCLSSLKLFQELWHVIMSNSISMKRCWYIDYELRRPW